MSITLEISCRKCDQKFDYIEIGFGSTHPVCLCSGCKHIVHPKKKVLHNGWFCRRCNQRLNKENAIDLYNTPMHTRLYKCPNGCGCDLDIEHYMHASHEIPTSFFGIFIVRIMTRISHYF